MQFKWFRKQKKERFSLRPFFLLHFYIIQLILAHRFFYVALILLLFLLVIVMLVCSNKLTIYWIVVIFIFVRELSLPCHVLHNLWFHYWSLYTFFDCDFINSSSVDNSINKRIVCVIRCFEKYRNKRRKKNQI